MPLPGLDLVSAASDKLQAMSPLNFLGPIMQLSLAKKQKKQAALIHPDRMMYQTSPFALENKALAQNAYNGRMAGAASAESNIQQAQANAFGNASRNASSGSQLLAMGAALQGQSDNSYANLAGREAQNKQAMLGQLMGANQGLIGEGDKVYNDKLLKYNEDTDAKNALLSSSIQNKFGGWTGIANTAMAKQAQGNQAMLQALPSLQNMNFGGGGYQLPGPPVGFNPFQHGTVQNPFG
jgi:hypothetical protein